ncbi:DUF7716 domain-containing protein [Chondrinema litorale]|uniref:DUF7716 domain-containing protein n=1 Tax=Chondrinema litorale TaxID=2994555 RepID=UPI00254286DE|nr:hypothetical protein [Chondrinema litorale]UZR96310.1 hypothetical protein OQ292_21875 [Chondrinema litorale]
MTLKEAILNCNQYGEAEELIYQVFAKRIVGKFESNSEAIVLALTEVESELNIKEIAESKCPGFDYFLELYIIQEIFQNMEDTDEYKSDEAKVKRTIYYAEFDA